MRLRSRRSTLVAAVVATGFVVGVQPALSQVVPTPPPIPPLPGAAAEAAMPAVPAWDASVGTACNIALTALNLGALLGRGVPAMLPETPVVDAGTEARAAMGASTAAGSACFILPFRTVRSSCAADAQAEQQLSGIGGQAGAPVNPGEFTPHLGGAAVDTVTEVENAGVHAGASSTLASQLSCPQVDLLAQPEFPTPELPPFPLTESSAQDVAIKQGEGVPTGISGGASGFGGSGGSGQFASASGGSGGGAGAGSVTGTAAPASGARQLGAAPAGQISSTRKAVAGVLAALIALMLAFMAASHAREAQPRAPRL